MPLFGITLQDFKAARRQIQERWPGRYVEIWPDVFDEKLFWVGGSAKALLDEVKVPHAVRLTVDEDRVPIFFGDRAPGAPDVLPEAESVRARSLAGRGIGVALVEEGGSRPSVEPSGPEDAYFFLSRPRAGRYFIWRLFRSKADAREFVRKHKVADADLEGWIASAPVETFEELVRPAGLRP